MPENNAAEKKEFDFDLLKQIFDILVAYIKEIIAIIGSPQKKKLNN